MKPYKLFYPSSKGKLKTIPRTYMLHPQTRQQHDLVLNRWKCENKAEMIIQ